MSLTHFPRSRSVDEPQRAPLAALCLSRFSLWMTIVSVACAIGCGSASTAPPASGCQGKTVPPGLSSSGIQSLLDSSGAGATLCFSPGIYRLTTPVSPQENQILVGAGQRGTTLSGSQMVTGFQATGAVWVAPGFLPSTPNPGTRAPCQVGILCQLNEDVYLDGQVLGRAPSLGSLGPNQYFEDYPNNRIYLGSNPEGHTVEQAIASSIVQVCQAENPHCSNGVTLQNIVIEEAANPSETGAIDAEGTSGWVLSNNEVRLNHGVGIVVDGATIQANFVHHNGQSGIDGTCQPDNSVNPTACFPSSTHPLQVLDNEIAFNNTLRFSAQFGAGGAKWAATYGLVVRGNNVHDNLGPGLWCDITCYDALFEQNTLSRNILQKTAPLNGDGGGGGIVYEVSNKAIIRNNTFVNNDPDPALGNDGLLLAAAIAIAESSNVEAYGNMVTGFNGIGMTMVSSETDPNTGAGLGRIDWCGTPPQNVYPDGSPFCTGTNSLQQPIHEVLNARIHDNTSVETSLGEMGGLDSDMGSAALRYFVPGIYSSNTYHLPDPVAGTYFPWCAQRQCGALTPPQWRAVGQDTNGVFEP